VLEKLKLVHASLDLSPDAKDELFIVKGLIFAKPVFF
jgi:hypothetical protein